MLCRHLVLLFFFFNDTATTEIYTLSLHDALPICTGSTCRVKRSTCRVKSATVRARDRLSGRASRRSERRDRRAEKKSGHLIPDRKSTRLNSSHSQISYAVFCLKKKILTDSTKSCP